MNREATAAYSFHGHAGFCRPFPHLASWLGRLPRCGGGQSAGPAQGAGAETGPHAGETDGACRKNSGVAAGKDQDG